MKFDVETVSLMYTKGKHLYEEMWAKCVFILEALVQTRIHD